MNAPTARPGGELAQRLAFFKGLQALTTRVHATHSQEELVFGLSDEVCSLFGARRMLVFMADRAQSSLRARVRDAGMVRVLRLPIAPRGVVGLCAFERRMLNLPNVSNLAAMQSLADDWTPEDIEDDGPQKQALAAPIINGEDDSLIGVILLSDSVDDEPFTSAHEEGLQGLARTLAVALSQRQHADMPLRSRYDQLVACGRLTQGDLDAAVAIARQRRLSVEQVLREGFACTDIELGESMARFYEVPYEPYRADRVRPIDLLRNIKREYASKSLWLPLEENGQGITIIAIDPEQVASSRVAQNVFLDARINYRVTTQREFALTVAQFFDTMADDLDVGDLLSEMGEDDEGYGSADDLSAAADNELVKLVNRVIVDAHRQGVSDIHIEPRPGKEKTLIRFRKDGVLMPYIEVPASYRNALVARIKIMCDLDIAERRKPQDGKIRFRKYGPLDIELRVATVPTSGGAEDVVMRLLSGGEPLALDDLALSPHNLACLKETISKPYGIFFVCGPTGSGKTTTLHSVLKSLNTPETKIWTAEDPVEITQRGLRQVQVNRKAGLTFATVMRSFLRADPDIIMVGEMRDSETVSIGIEASLTGHLVLSTLHTNSAPESVVRLLDMGMDPFNFADALLGVLAQRLARRLCKSCSQAYAPSPEEIDALLSEYCEDLRKTEGFARDPDAARTNILEAWRTQFADASGNFVLHRAKGCPECSNSGYRGRIALHELMVGTEEAKRRIQMRAPVADLFATALHDGMRTLRQDGIEKVLAGHTDMAQVRKVCLR
ncbi:MAG: GspE/PulE family protein [Rhodocyclaceae bacterium]